MPVTGKSLIIDRILFPKHLLAEIPVCLTVDPCCFFKYGYLEQGNRW